MKMSKCNISAHTKLFIIALLELIVNIHGLLGTIVIHKLLISSELNYDAIVYTRTFLVLQYLIWTSGIICLGILFYGIVTKYSKYVLINIISSNIYNFSSISFLIWQYFSTVDSGWKTEKIVFLEDLLRIGCLFWSVMFFFILAAKVSCKQQMEPIKKIDLILPI